MGFLTLSRINEKGDIPTFEFKNKTEMDNILDVWAETTGDNTVFVSFPSEQFDYKYPYFHTSNCLDSIYDFIFDYYNHSNVNHINHNIFEFENHKEAFNYCIDLTDGSE